MYLFVAVRRQNTYAVARALSSISKHIIFSYSVTRNQSGWPWLRLELQTTDQAERLDYSPDLATLKGSSCTDIMTCTGGCGYNF